MWQTLAVDSPPGTAILCTFISFNSHWGNSGIFIPSHKRQKLSSETVNDLTNTNQTQIQTLGAVGPQSSGSRPLHCVRPKHLFIDLSGCMTTTFERTLNWLPNSLGYLGLSKLLQGQHFISLVFFLLSILFSDTLFTFSHSCHWVTSVSGKENITIQNIGSGINNRNLHRSQQKPREVTAVSRWLRQICSSKWNCNLRY